MKMSGHFHAQCPMDIGLGRAQKNYGRGGEEKEITSPASDRKPIVQS
jgi:hypothetical protein